MKNTIIAIVGIALLAVATIGFVALATSVDLSDPATAAKMTIALIALFGVVFTATMTLMTAMINRSVQREGQKLTATQQDANATQAAIAERRLKIEAAVKAVELFGTTTGEGTPQQNTGALFALVTLGYEEFALHLLDQLWPSGKVTRHGAVWVLGQALSSQRTEAQLAGAEILAEHAGLLLNEHRTDLEWPTGGTAWPAGIPLMARHAVMTALLRAFVALDPNTADERVERGIIGLLLDARDKDPHLQVQATATLALSAALQVLADNDKLTLDDREPRSVAQEKKRIVDDLPAARLAALPYFVDLAQEVESWVGKRKTRSRKPTSSDTGQNESGVRDSSSPPA